MRVCIFTADYLPVVGGMAAYSKNVAYALGRSKDVAHVQVVALRNRLHGEDRATDTLSVIRDGGRSLVHVAIAIVRYSIAFRKYDVFHATSVFPVGFLVLCVGKYMLRKRVFVSFHGTDVLTTEGSWLTKWAKAFVLRHARCITVSRSTRDLAAEKYHIDRGAFPVILPPLEATLVPSDATAHASELRDRYGIGRDDTVVLFVGNLVRRKGAELLVRALSVIDDDSIRLVIVGDGLERDNLRNHIAELHLEHRVVLAGRVPDIEPYYAMADVFSMPSFFDHATGDVEGLGIVYLEAQYRGLPVIGTRSGGIPEAIDEGKSGFIVEERDVDALAGRIVALARDPSLRRTMGERGKRFVAERFGEDRAVRDLLGVYRS